MLGREGKGGQVAIETPCDDCDRVAGASGKQGSFEGAASYGRRPGERQH